MVDTTRRPHEFRCRIAKRAVSFKTKDFSESVATRGYLILADLCLITLAIVQPDFS